MKRFEVKLTPSKAYDLQLFCKLSGIEKYPSAIDELAEEFQRLSHMQKIYERIKLRHGRILLGAAAFDDCSKAFELYGRYKRERGIKKILISYQYHLHLTYSSRKQQLVNYIAKYLELPASAISFNENTPETEVLIMISKKQSLAQLLDEYQPDMLIVFGFHANFSTEISIVSKLVQHLGIVIFDDVFSLPDQINQNVKYQLTEPMQKLMLLDSQEAMNQFFSWSFGSGPLRFIGPNEQNYTPFFIKFLGIEPLVEL
jgi:hypothetical protein